MKRLLIVLSLLSLLLLTSSTGRWGIYNPDYWGQSRWGLGEEDTVAIDPRLVDDLVCYYRADTLLEESDTSPPENGEEITKFTSLVNSYSQSGLTTKIPYYYTNQYNSKSCTRWDGTDDLYTTVSQMTNAFVAGFTFIMVCKIDDGRPLDYIFLCIAKDNVAPKYDYLYITLSTAGSLAQSLNVNGEDSTIILEALCDNGELSACIITVVCDTTTMVGYVNGVPVDTVDISGFNYSAIANNTGTEKIPICGGWLNGAAYASHGFDGDLMIHAMYGRALDWQERVNVEAYLQAYYAIPAGRDIND